MGNRIIITTDTYPNRGGDSNFIIPEIELFKEKFDITVICNRAHSCDMINTTDGVNYFEHRIRSRFWVLKLIKNAVSYFSNPFCREEARDIFGTEGIRQLTCFRRISQLIQSILMYSHAEDFFCFVKKSLDLTYDTRLIWYSYWCNECCLAMALHKDEYVNVKCISRLHGYDLYNKDYCIKGGRQPFRKLINDKVDRLLFVGARGIEYYVNEYPNVDISKLSLNKIGSKDIGKLVLHGGERFQLLSCSNVIPLKRVEKIVEALTFVENRIDWIHIGSGTEYESVAYKAKSMLSEKENIRYVFLGNIDKDSVYDFYRKNSIGAFITTSMSEGAPVSIMEAMSMGIPIIATAVGDIPNMLNENGILLPENPSAREVAEAIDKVAYLWYIDKYKNQGEYKEMCAKSRTIWEKEYDADKNALRLLKELELYFAE